MKHKPRSNLKEYEDRWEQASDAAWREWLSVLRDLQGDWKVERLSGLLPMTFVWKRIRGSRGETYVLPPSWRTPGLSFELEQREGYVALIYRPPLSFLIDELRLEADGLWLGRANVAGFQYSWFRMVPMQIL